MNKLVAFYLNGVEVTIKKIEGASIELFDPVGGFSDEEKNTMKALQSSKMKWSVTIDSIRIQRDKNIKLVKRLAARAIIYSSLHS